MLGLLRGRAAAVGHIDYYNDPVIIGAFSGKVGTGFPKENATSIGSPEQSLRSWLRSSFVFLPPAELRLLGSLVSIDDPQSLFSGDPESPFRGDAPLSANYRQYIIGWLTGRGTGQGVEWHSRFSLT